MWGWWGERGGGGDAGGAGMLVGQGCWWDRDAGGAEMLAEQGCWRSRDAGGGGMLVEQVCWQDRDAGRAEMLAGQGCWHSRDAGDTGCWWNRDAGRAGMLAGTEPPVPGRLTDAGLPNGVGLAGAGLSVGKDGGVEAAEEGAQQRLDAGPVHGRLPRRLGQHGGEAEPAAAQRHLARGGIAPQAGPVSPQRLPGQQRPHPHRHPHRRRLRRHGRARRAAMASAAPPGGPGKEGGCGRAGKENAAGREGGCSRSSLRPGESGRGERARPWLQELRGAAPRCSGEAPSLGRCSVTPGMLHHSQGAPSLVRCFISCVNRGVFHLW